MATDAPQFSVVIPVYNGARYIARSVGSALRQEGASFEVIVVDDGSSDGSADLAAAIDPSVRVIRHAKNSWLPAARNTGIRAAKGEFVAFLDADDWWPPNKLAAQAALFAAAPELGATFTDFELVRMDGSPGSFHGGLASELPPLGLTLVPVGDAGCVLEGSVVNALIRHGSFMAAPTVVVRRAVFDRSGLFDETMRYAEDLEMWVRLAGCCKIGMVTRVLAHIEQRPDSMSHQSMKMDEYLVRLYTRYLTEFKDLPPDLKAHVKRTVESRHAGLGWHHRKAGDMPTARRHYRAAMSLKFRARTLAALLRTYLPAALR